MVSKIILIGSTGFIGKSIVKNFKGKITKFNSKNLDLSNKATIERKAKNFKNSTIIYAAGLKRTRGDTFENFNKNLILFNNLFSCFAKNKPKKIIFLSSAEVYGYYKGKKKIDESSMLRPVTIYSMAKIIQEKIIKFFASRLGYQYLILRIPGVYGKDSENQSIVSKLVAALNKNYSFKLTTSGNELRDYIYVDDIGKIIFKLSKLRLKNLTINLSTGKSFKILEIIKFIENNFKKKIYFHKKRFTKKNEYNLIYNNSLLKRYIPNYNFQLLDSFDYKGEFR